ncbi:MAG: hypothetical protein U5J63_15710 [Fodinibius sp.]|nr:hypothetical protein [Fodinibius sp.]
MGNHDILDSEKYHSGIINLFSKLSIDPFLLVHDVNEHDQQNNSQYVLSGHIHPAVQLSGQGRQRMKLPCFYFGSRYGILPAFGEFTGTHVIEPDHDDRIFMIVDSQIIPASELKS